MTDVIICVAVLVMMLLYSATCVYIARIAKDSKSRTIKILEEIRAMIANEEPRK